MGGSRASWMPRETPHVGEGWSSSIALALVGYRSAMVTVDEFAAMAMAFPGVTEGTRWGNRTWSVGKQTFAWERPFSKADVKRFGAEPVPAGPIAALRVEDLGEKEAVLAEGRPGFFTIPHFDGYPAVLVQLSVVGKRQFRESLEDAWLCSAPETLVEQYLSRRR